MIVTDYNEMTVFELIAISMLGKSYIIEDGKISGVVNSYESEN